MRETSIYVERIALQTGFVMTTISFRVTFHSKEVQMVCQQSRAGALRHTAGRILAARAGVGMQWLASIKGWARLLHHRQI